MDFTFGIITAGDADHLILKIIESIEQQNIPNYEIIIVGNSEVSAKNLRVMAFDETVKPGWITKKKNIVYQESKYENIVVIHDYISFDNGWYTGFLEFGNTFEYCVSKIKTIDGTRYIDYVFFNGEKINTYTQSRYFLPYSYIPPANMKKLLYISGAYFIIKRSIALRYHLDENLLHGEGEDIEYSQRLSNNNIYAVCNKYSSVSLLKSKSNVYSEELVSLKDLEYLESLSSDKIDEIASGHVITLNKHIYETAQNTNFDMYAVYANYVKTISNTNDLSNFKNHPSYTYMLEHVSAEQGRQYIKSIHINTKLSINDVVSFCNLNDSVGNPNTIEYGIVTASPTSLRYIYFAHLILTHIKSLNLPVLNIVEIGGGYGGLCLAIHYFSEAYGVKVNTYKIIDLLTINKLQEMYISKVNSNISVEYIDAATFGSDIKDTNLFLISTYCFSEIPLELQHSYIKTLFPKVSHGFIAWNIIPLYDFGFTLKVEDEIPSTFPNNKYLYF